MNPVHVIGVPLDLGADRRGVDVEPSACAAPAARQRALAPGLRIP